MPVSVALILGEEASARYHETGKIPTIDWLQNHSGEVCRRTYPDYHTYKAVKETVEKTIGYQDGLVVILEESPAQVHTFGQQREALVKGVVTDIRSIADYIQGIFPHTVLAAVKTDAGDSFKHYTLVGIHAQNAICTLEDPDTLKRSRHPLKSIGIDCLMEIWQRCRSLMAENGTWRDHAIAFLQKQSHAALPYIRKYVDQHWQKLLPDAENLAAFRIYQTLNQ